MPVEGCVKSNLPHELSPTDQRNSTARKAPSKGSPLQAFCFLLHDGKWRLCAEDLHKEGPQVSSNEAMLLVIPNHAGLCIPQESAVCSLLYIYRGSCWQVEGKCAVLAFDKICISAETPRCTRRPGKARLVLCHMRSANPQDALQARSPLMRRAS